MDDLLDHVSDGVLLVDAGGTITGANAVVAELLECERSALIGTDALEVFPESVESTFHDRFESAVESPGELSFEEYYPTLQSWFDVTTASTEAGLAVYLRDVTWRRELEGEVAQKDGELDRLNRINAIIEEIIRELIGATTRAEIERTVCERLAGSDLYEFTWICEDGPADGAAVLRTAAGEYEELVDRLVENEGSADGSEPLEHTVLRSGETNVVRQLVGGAVPQTISRVAFARGLQSAIAVPIEYGSTMYGVLAVYASRADAFSERERESLETLGVATGFVINAARQRNLLLSDTVVELTFRVADDDDSDDDCGDGDDFLATASEQFDCALTLEGIVPLDDRTLLCYVSIADAEPHRVLSMAVDHPGIDDGRVIHETAAEEATVGGLVELIVTGSSPLLALTERGATIRTAEYEAGVGRLVAELAPDEDVREVVTGVSRTFPGASLLAKRERQRPVETAGEFRSALYDRLTDRQQTALLLAFHAGYFQSPRESTGEQLAERLGISSPTLAYHLRAAEHKLVDAFLDEGHEERGHSPLAEWPGGSGGDE